MSEFCCIILQYSSAGQCCSAVGAKTLGQPHSFCTRNVNSDVFQVDGLLPRLQGKVDVLVFNPPYVVTPSEEVPQRRVESPLATKTSNLCGVFLTTLVIGFHQVGSRGIEAAWAGGVRGREVTDQFLPAVAQLLSSQGLFYLVTIAENDPGEHRASRPPTCSS